MGDYQYLARHARSSLANALKVFPVVVLMGARQTGKSTLVQNEPGLRDHQYFTLDDLDVGDRAVRAPDDLIRAGPHIILDEVQRVPELILAIKRAVDRDHPRVRGRFVLTGSANLLLMQKVSESLAGRAGYVTLWPFTRRERAGLGSAGIWSELINRPTAEWLDLVSADRAPAADWATETRIGGYPVPSTEIERDDLRSIWFDGYVRTYLERDLQDIAAIDNLVDFRRLMRAATARLGNLVNQTELARDTAIPRSTVQRYLNILETSFQLVRLEPYTVNRTTRLIRSPKLYWSDSGLAGHLGGDSAPRGAHLENLVLGDLLVWRDAQIPTPEILYWRTASNFEVDFVIEHNDRLLPIEVKTSTRASTADIRGLARFRDEYGKKCIGGLLLHAGETIEWISRNILAVPWHRVL